MNTKGLKIKKLSKALKGMIIVNNVTASFLPDRITALIGPNGAGKTTFFHLITGELKPDKGDILYNNQNITAFAPYEIARQGIGRLFQDVRVFENLSVFENVAVSCYDYHTETPWFPFYQIKRLKSLNKTISEKAAYYLDLVGLFELKDSPAFALSYGQQKLLAIARLLVGEFSLLLLDEPTAGLNSVMLKKVLDILNKIVDGNKGKTVILVEHDMNVITEAADWVYFMNEGRIAFFGRTDHVLGDKEVRELYLGI